MGTPSTYTQEMADRICAGVANGKSLRSVCDCEGMPDRETVFRWRRENEEFRGQYDAARREGAHAMADDIQAIVDDEALDPNSRRIRMDARKWIASKMLPKVYGDKLALGGDEDAGPLVVTWLGSAP